MSPASGKPHEKRALSLDAWAVIVAFLLAALVRLGLIRTIPW